MGSWFRSIKVRVWARFEMVVVAMLAFIYVFLIAMYPTFYSWMKQFEIEETFGIIRSNWESDDLFDILIEQASEKKMFIEINKPVTKISFLANKLGGNLSFSVLAKDNIVSDIKSSPTGKIYKSFRDEQEDNSVMMMGSFIGDDKNNPEAYVFICNYLEPIGTTVIIFVRQFFIVGIIMIILTVFISALFSSKISEPIIRIKNSAKDLPQGKFDAKIDKYDYEEIKQLSGTLATASREIAKSDDLRRELMANISHDLRTPLTMIKAYAEMIRDLSGDNPEKRERHLKVIIDETDRLSSLVTDILDLSKLQAGVTELHTETFNFSERLSSVTARFDIIKENEGVCIELDADDDILLNADKTKIEQVVYNLINNAVTYAGADNLIIVSLHRIADGKFRFCVEDHGEGISPENLPYVWDRYYKVNEPNATHKRAKMGSGIGLSIVKSVLELHGFAFGVNSSVGEGSVFWFEAPEYGSEILPESEKPVKRRLLK